MEGILIFFITGLTGLSLCAWIAHGQFLIRLLHFASFGMAVSLHAINSVIPEERTHILQQSHL
jgi:hypothetical protein